MATIRQETQRQMMDRLFAERAGLPPPPPPPRPLGMEGVMEKLMPGRAQPMPPVVGDSVSADMLNALRAAPAMARNFAKDALIGMAEFDPSDMVSPIGMASKGGKGLAKATKSLADDYINFSKMGLSDEAETALRKTIERNAQLGDEIPGALPNPKPTLPDKAVEAQAKRLDPESLLTLEPLRVGEGAYPPAVSKALRDNLKGSMEQLQDATKAVESAATEADRMMAIARANRLEADVNKLVQLQSAARSEAGRGLRVWRLMADSNTDPAFWLGRAQQKAGGKLPGSKQLELNGILSDIAGAADDEAKSAAKMRLAKWMNQFEQDGLTEVLLAWRKAGLVSGLKSHARNIGGNMSFMAMREVSQVPEWITDSMFRLFTKQRTIGTPGVGMWRGLKAGATKGIQEAGEVWNHGMTREMANKWDVPRELNSIAFGGGKADKVINKWVNYNFRALGAEDKVFRAYAYRRGLDNGAQAMAATERIQGKLPTGVSVAQRAEQLAANPPKELAAEAMYAADYAVFANKNGIASWINAGKRQGKGGHVALDLMMPYVTTPTNIFARIFEYTPAGTVTTVARQAPDIWRKGLRKEQQKAISEAVGRGATGTALIAAGWWMAENGRLTGLPSDSPGGRNVQNAAGRPPLSVKLGEEWRRTNEFAPGAPLLHLGATMFEEANRPLKDEASRVDKLVGGALGTFKEMPLLQGIESVSRLAESPTKFPARYAAEQVGTMVPTISADIARAGDNFARSTRDQGLMAKAKERLPFMRGDLPLYRDRLGRPIKSDPRHMYDPTLPKKETNDPVLRELDSIKAQIGNLGKMPEESQDTYTVRSAVNGALVYERLKERMRDRVWEETAASKRIRSRFSGLRAADFAPAAEKTYQKAESAWSKLSDEQKRKEVSRIVSQVSREMSDDLEGKPEAAAQAWLLNRFGELARKQPELVGGQR